jgi:hypothetical protein
LQKNPPRQQLAFVNAFDDCNAMVFTRYVNPLWRLKRWLVVGSEARLLKQVSTLNNILHSFIDNRQRELSGDVKYGVSYKQTRKHR